jgi:bifunctional UDP-N-acetylglucosamine pyrophosphorylase/glucosamine-1-phosphate N-acetyltransferase
MVLYVLDALAEVDVREVVVVVGHRGDVVTKSLVEHAPLGISIEFVEQESQLGTADALAVGLTGLPPFLADADGDVVVLPGDTPLVRPTTLVSLVRHHRATQAAATILTARLPDPEGYDRVVRSGRDGRVVRVVEDAEVGDAERDVDEVATTIHCFRHGVLAPALRRLRPVAPTGEHSLTGIYAVLHDAGYRVESLVVDDPMEAAGVNDRAQLAVAEAELRDRVNERWMRHGVTMWDPERTYVDASVILEPDVAIMPGVMLRGACVVRRGAEIGPDCLLEDTEVGEGAVVCHSTARRAVVGARASVGPYAVLMPGARVAEDAVVEPFSTVGPEPPGS